MDKQSVYNGAGQVLYRRAKSLIPGGTQLLSKRPEMFLPEYWPAYYSRAAGARVWDLDGREFLDMSYCGIGATVLGYCDPDVDAAVLDRIKRGSMTTLNCPEEVELAELLIELHPWAAKVRYARCGGEAMAVATRIARAHTRRDVVLFCGYHGWHDWYLSANLEHPDHLQGHLMAGLEPAGVPSGLAGTSFGFPYNDVATFKARAAAFGDRLAAVIMEPMRETSPDPDYLASIKEITHSHGAVLVFDEVTSAWRVNTGGIHRTLGVEPDIAVFAKGMSNGYPMAAILGTDTVMQSAERSFISSTYWTEGIGPTAALATIRKHRDLQVSERLIELGTQVTDGLQAAADKVGVAISTSGIAPLTHFHIDHPQAQALHTLFCQSMLERGILANKSFYAMYAHTDADVATYLRAVGEVFTLVAEAIAAGDVDARLWGPQAHQGFQRLTQGVSR